MAKELFHISNEPDVKEFEPRSCKNPITGKSENLVWAIDADHLHNYLLPRDCPRVTYFVKEDTTAEDIKRLMSGTAAKYVVAIEITSFSKIIDEVLYKYVFDSKGFELIDEAAGYYVSKNRVIPKSVYKITDILNELLQYDVELRIMPSLWELRENVIHSTMQYSIIRMKNASPPAKGYDKYHPLP